MVTLKKSLNIVATTSTFGRFSDFPINEIEDAGYNLIINPYKRRLAKSELIELLT